MPLESSCGGFFSENCVWVFGFKGDHHSQARALRYSYTKQAPSFEPPSPPMCGQTFWTHPRFTPPPPLYLPAPNARSSECAVYCSVLVEVNVIMGAGTDSLVEDVVEVNVIMSAGMHSIVSDFAVNNSNLAVVEVFIRML